MAVAKKLKRRWKNEDLMEAFDTLAHKYFSGKLHRPTSLSFVPLDGLGHTFRYRTVGKRRSSDDLFGINISNKLRFSRRLWETTLIHEMVHLEQRNRFSCGLRGKEFNKRMRELAYQGAFDGLW
jgi:hypothetical protein